MIPTFSLGLGLRGGVEMVIDANIVTHRHRVHARRRWERWYLRAIAAVFGKWALRLVFRSEPTMRRRKYRVEEPAAWIYRGKGLFAQPTLLIHPALEGKLRKELQCQ